MKHTTALCSAYRMYLSCADPLQLGLEAVARSGIQSCDKVYVGWTARNQSRTLQRRQINHLKRDGAEKDKQIGFLFQPSLFLQQDVALKSEWEEKPWHRQAQRGDPPMLKPHQDPRKRIYCKDPSQNTSSSVLMCGQWFHVYTVAGNNLYFIF